MAVFSQHNPFNHVLRDDVVREYVQRANCTDDIWNVWFKWQTPPQALVASGIFPAIGEVFLPDPQPRVPLLFSRFTCPPRPPPTAITSRYLQLLRPLNNDSLLLATSHCVPGRSDMSPSADVQLPRIYLDGSLDVCEFITALFRASSQLPKYDHRCFVRSPPSSDPLYFSMSDSQSFPLLWRPSRAFLHQLGRTVSAEEHVIRTDAGTAQDYCVTNITTPPWLPKGKIVVSAKSIETMVSELRMAEAYTTHLVELKAWPASDGSAEFPPDGAAPQRVMVEDNVVDVLGDEVFEITSEEVEALKDSVRYYTGRFMPPLFFARLYAILAHDSRAQFYFDRRDLPLKLLMQRSDGDDRLGRFLTHLVACEAYSSNGARREPSKSVRPLGWQEAGFTSFAHLEAVLSQSLSELSTNVCMSTQGYFFLGESQRIAPKTTHPITIVSAAGVDFNYIPSGLGEYSKYFSEDAFQEGGKDALRDRLKELYHLIFVANKEARVTNPTAKAMGLGQFLPIICREDVMRVYMEAQFELLCTHDYGFQSYWLNAAGATRIAATLLKTKQYPFRCNVVLHDRDVRSLVLALSGRGLSTSFLNTADFVSLLQGRVGHQWETGEGSSFNSEEVLGATTTLLLAQFNVQYPRPLEDLCDADFDDLVSRISQPAVPRPTTLDTVSRATGSADVVGGSIDWGAGVSTAPSFFPHVTTSSDFVSLATAGSGLVSAATSPNSRSAAFGRAAPHAAPSLVPFLTGVPSRGSYFSFEYQGRGGARITTRICTVLWVATQAQLRTTYLPVIAVLRSFGARVLAFTHPDEAMHWLRGEGRGEVVNALISDFYHEWPADGLGGAGGGAGLTDGGAGSYDAGAFDAVAGPSFDSQAAGVSVDGIKTKAGSAGGSVTTTGAGEAGGVLDISRKAEIRGTLQFVEAVRTLRHMRHDAPSAHDCLFPIIVNSLCTLGSPLQSVLYSSGVDVVVFNLHQRHIKGLVSLLARYNVESQHLWRAATECDLSLVQRLVFRGADPLRSWAGVPPLHVAVLAASHASESDCHQIIKLLCTVDPSQPTMMSSFVPRIYVGRKPIRELRTDEPDEVFGTAEERARARRIALCRRGLQLLSQGLELPVGAHKTGSTPLHIAVRMRLKGVVRALLETEISLLTQLAALEVGAPDVDAVTSERVFGNSSSYAYDAAQQGIGVVETVYNGPRNAPRAAAGGVSGDIAITALKTSKADDDLYALPAPPSDNNSSAGEDTARAATASHGTRRAPSQSVAHASEPLQRQPLAPPHLDAMSPLADAVAATRAHIPHVISLTASAALDDPYCPPHLVLAAGGVEYSATTPFGLAKHLSGCFLDSETAAVTEVYASIRRTFRGYLETAASAAGTTVDEVPAMPMMSPVSFGGGGPGSACVAPQAGAQLRSPPSDRGSSCDGFDAGLNGPVGVPDTHGEDGPRCSGSLDVQTAALQGGGRGVGAGASWSAADEERLRTLQSNGYAAPLPGRPSPSTGLSPERGVRDQERVAAQWRRHAPQLRYMSVVWITTASRFHPSSNSLRQSIASHPSLHLLPITYDGPVTPDVVTEWLRDIEETILECGGLGLLKLTTVVVELGGTSSEHRALYTEALDTVARVLLVNGAAVDPSAGGAVSVRVDTDSHETLRKFGLTDDWIATQPRGICVPVPAVVLPPHMRDAHRKQFFDKAGDSHISDTSAAQFAGRQSSLTSGPCPWVKLIRFLPGPAGGPDGWTEPPVDASPSQLAAHPLPVFPVPLDGPFLFPIRCDGDVLRGGGPSRSVGGGSFVQTPSDAAVRSALPAMVGSWTDRGVGNMEAVRAERSDHLAVPLKSTVVDLAVKRLLGDPDVVPPLYVTRTLRGRALQREWFEWFLRPPSSAVTPWRDRWERPCFSECVVTSIPPADADFRRPPASDDGLHYHLIMGTLSWSCYVNDFSHRVSLPYTADVSYLIEKAYMEGRSLTSILLPRRFEEQNEVVVSKYTVDLNRFLQYMPTNPLAERLVFRGPLPPFLIEAQFVDSGGLHLVREIRQGRCVAFTGAGFAAPAGGPSWGRLLQLVAERGVMMEQRVHKLRTGVDAALLAASVVPSAGGRTPGGTIMASRGGSLSDPLLDGKHGDESDEDGDAGSAVTKPRKVSISSAAATMTGRIRPGHALVAAAVSAAGGGLRASPSAAGNAAGAGATVAVRRDIEVMERVQEEVGRLISAGRKDDFELAAQMLDDGLLTVLNDGIALLQLADSAPTPLPSALRADIDDVRSVLSRGRGSLMQRLLARLMNELPSPSAMDAMFTHSGGDFYHVMVNRLRAMQCVNFEALLTTNYTNEHCTCDGRYGAPHLICNVCHGRTPMYTGAKAEREPPYFQLLRASGRARQHPLVIQIHGTASPGYTPAADEDATCHADVHGRADSIVFTREQYRKLLHSQPGYVKFLNEVMVTRTILYMGFSFTDDYLNELRSDVVSRLEDSDSTHPLGYAIINDRPPQHVEYYGKHEGVKMLSWSVAQHGYGIADRYLDCILRSSSLAAALSLSLVVMLSASNAPPLLSAEMQTLQLSLTRTEDEAVRRVLSDRYFPLQLKVAGSIAGVVKHMRASSYRNSFVVVPCCVHSCFPSAEGVLRDLDKLTKQLDAVVKLTLHAHRDVRGLALLLLTKVFEVVGRNGFGVADEDTLRSWDHRYVLCGRAAQFADAAVDESADNSGNARNDLSQPSTRRPSGIRPVFGGDSPHSGDYGGGGGGHIDSFAAAVSRLLSLAAAADGAAAGAGSDVMSGTSFVHASSRFQSVPVDDSSAMPLGGLSAREVCAVRDTVLAVSAVAPFKSLPAFVRPILHQQLLDSLWHPLATSSLNNSLYSTVLVALGRPGHDVGVGPQRLAGWQRRCNALLKEVSPDAAIHTAHMRVDHDQRMLNMTAKVADDEVRTYCGKVLQLLSYAVGDTGDVERCGAGLTARWYDAPPSSKEGVLAALLSPHAPGDGLMRQIIGDCARFLVVLYLHSSMRFQYRCTHGTVWAESAEEVVWLLSTGALADFT